MFNQSNPSGLTTLPVKRIKLLVLASTYPRWECDPEPGFVHELSKRLADVFDVTVLCPHAPGALKKESFDGVQILRYHYAPQLLETLVNHGGITTNLRKNPWKWLLLPGFLLAQFWETRKLIRRFRPDIIHAHWLIPQGLIAALLSLLDNRTPPFLVTSHGADLFALHAFPFQILKRFVVRRAAALTVVSQAMSKELLRLGVDEKKIQVQPMGVDLHKRFIPDPLAFRSNDEILFVGRLVEKKGLTYLLDAMPEILSAHPSTYLNIAGFGPEETTLKNQVQKLNLQDKVCFLGAVGQAQLPALYRRAAVLVAPFVPAQSGDVEGLGLVVVEALGCCCPVVVGDVPAVHDLLSPDSGWVVAARDKKQLASAVLSVLNNHQLAKVKTEQIRKQISEKFSWHNVSAQYAGMIKSLLSAKAINSAK